MDWDIRKDKNKIDSIVFSDEYKLMNPAGELVSICSTEVVRGATPSLVVVKMEEVDTLIKALEKAKEVFSK